MDERIESRSARTMLLVRLARALGGRRVVVSNEAGVLVDLNTEQNLAILEAVHPGHAPNNVITTRERFARWVRAFEVRSVPREWPALRLTLADMRRVAGLGGLATRTRLQWVDGVGWYWRRA